MTQVNSWFETGFSNGLAGPIEKALNWRPQPGNNAENRISWGEEK